MRRLVFTALCVAAGLGPGCQEASIELPRDAARPMRPAAALAPVAPDKPSAAAPDLNSSAAPAGAMLGGEVTRVPKATLRASVTPLLRGRALAHRVYQARFGPTATTDAPTAIVLTQTGTPLELGGFALSGGKQYALPRLHDGDGALQRVVAIMFRNVDLDPDREVIALITYADEDPEAPPYFSNVVLDWDASRGRFVRLEQLEGEVEALPTAGDVLARLRKLRAEP